MSIDKTATTKHPVAEFIKKRWSPRAFANRPVSHEDIETIIEAGSWSFSSSNEQPWRFIVAHHGSELFSRIHNCLNEANKPWTAHAAVLLISIAKTTLSKDHTENRWAQHDVGAANMCMALQATFMDIYAHPMAGFNKERTIGEFKLAQDLQPLTFMALGYLGDASGLAESNQTRELAPRTRKDLSDIIINIS